MNMTISKFGIICLATALLIFAGVQRDAMLAVLVTQKATAVVAAITATVIAAVIEITGVIDKKQRSGLDADDIRGVWVKLFAAIALVATVCSSAEDLSKPAVGGRADAHDSQER